MLTEAQIEKRDSKIESEIVEDRKAAVVPTTPSEIDILEKMEKTLTEDFTFHSKEASKGGQWEYWHQNAMGYYGRRLTKIQDRIKELKEVK